MSEHIADNVSAIEIEPEQIVESMETVFEEIPEVNEIKETKTNKIRYKQT